MDTAAFSLVYVIFQFNITITNNKVRKFPASC